MIHPKYIIVNLQRTRFPVLKKQQLVYCRRQDEEVK